VAAADDFFGLATLGADPYHALQANKLSRFQMMDQILQGQASGQPTRPGGMQMAPRQMASSQMQPDPGGGVPGGNFGQMLSMLARTAMTRGSQPGGQNLSANSTAGGNADPNAGNCPPGHSYWPGYGCLPDSGPGPCKPGEMYAGGKCVPQEEPEPGPNPNPNPGPNPGPIPSPEPPPRTPSGGTSPGGGGPYTDETIPADLQNLRLALGQWLGQNFNKYNPQYGGQLTVPENPFMGQAAAAGQAGATGGMDWLNRGGGTLNSLLGFNAQSDLSQLQNPLSRILGGANSSFDTTGIQQLLNTSGANTAAARNYFDTGAGLGVQGANIGNAYLGQAGSFLNQLNSGPNSLMQTGGAPDIQSALDAIRNRGMMDIQDQSAQTREQFGAMGLGASSDVAEAVARGSSRGIAQITADQSQLAQSVLSAAKDRQLQSIIQGVGAGTNIGQTAGGLFGQAGQNYLGAGQGVLGQAGQFNNLGNLLLGTNTANAGFQNAGLDRILQGLPVGQNILNNPANLQLQSAGIQGQATGMLPGFAGASQQGNAQYAQLLAQLAGMDTQRQGNNISSLYQDFIRSTTNPYLNTAAGYATGFPPTPNPVNTGFGGWGALGSIGAAGLIALSDENLKEDIEEIEEPKPITKRLKQLPIKTWRFIGDPVRHIGPMAQDWQKTFGIGDGHTIYIPDMLNVLLGVLKETTHASN
jgi:hypothetical protein